MKDDLDGAVLVLEEASMISQARRFVAERLRSLGLDDVVADAQLVTSELVTNVFLHTNGAAELAVVAVPSGIRLEVRDSSPVPPVRANSDADTMTGRGLHLVDGIASRWGVTSLAVGKSVWAELRNGSAPDAPAGELDEEALLAMWAGEEWSDDDWAGEDGEHQTSGPATVTIGTAPTQLLLDAKAHVDNLVREFTLIAGGSASGASVEVPPAVTGLIDIVVNGFSGPRQTLKRLALAAAAGGEDQVVVELPVPSDVVGTIAAATTYLDALDQANAYCRAARLLTLESPPQHRMFHRWYVEEYIAHLERVAAGDPPQAPQPFTNRLLDEIGIIASAHRLADQAARLHALAVALSAAMTAEAVAEAVLDEGVAALEASGGVVLLAGDPSVLGVPGAVGHDDKVMARLRNEHPDAALPAAEAMRTGEAVWLESREERDERFPELIGFEPSTIAMCAVPMTLGDQRLGALRFSFNTSRIFDDQEREFVTAMAAQTAQALHRAELYGQRLDVAHRLQATLLPSRLPDIPGMDVAASYHPLADAMDVGGDFYDVWRCAEDHWAFAIGDVCGSGPEAAAITGLVRHTLRALTSTNLGIDEILQQLNHALLDAVDDADGNERFCTVTLGFLDLAGDRATVDLASGGHPEPILIRPDGQSDVIGLAGTLLGVFPEVEVERTRIHMDPGATLVLMTDGATEVRNDRGLLGSEGIAAAVAVPPTSAAGVVTRIEEAVWHHGGDRLFDDLALLVLRRR